MNIQPSCYGKSWDPDHVECRGGLDPAYEHPRNGTHHRDECSWLRPCGQIVEAERARQRQPMQLIPAQALTRPTAAPVPPRLPQAPVSYSPPRAPVQHMPQPTPSYQPQYVPPAPVYAPPPAPAPTQAQQYYQPAPQHMMVPPYVAQFGPQHVYPPYQLPGSQMPQYLTVPEPVNEGVHWLTRLGRELFRSIIKAFGHSLSAHADSNPFGKYKQ
jgi:hypothetical protein